MGDKQNIDYIEFETSGKNSKVKCKFIIMCVDMCVSVFTTTA